LAALDGAIVLNEADLLRYFPRLWHLTAANNWQSVVQHGLLSTSALLDLFQIDGTDRLAIEARRRPNSVNLIAPSFAPAIVRDNRPLTASALQKCLEADTTVEQWFRMLNARTFFWLSRRRVDTLLNAKAHRGKPHAVLTIDTSSLVAAHRDRIELSPINSGATLCKAARRGRRTFRGIADFPFDERRRTRTIENAVVELVVRGGVRDIVDHLVSVETVDRGLMTRRWTRAGSGDDDPR
jgi:hypothetical protein